MDHGRLRLELDGDRSEIVDRAGDPTQTLDDFDDVFHTDRKLSPHVGGLGIGEEARAECG